MAEPGLGKRLQYRLEYAAFRALAALCRALPLETASRLSGGGWRLVAPRLRRHARALGNLRLAFPEKSEAEREAIAHAMWDNLGRTFAEAFHAADLFTSDRIIVDNPAALAAFLARGGGVVCAPHLGNWELIAAAAVRGGANAAGTYQKIKNPLVDAYVLSLRLARHPGGLFAKSPAMPRKALRHVSKGGVLFIAADLRNAQGLPVPFFGRPAPSTLFPAMIARSVGAPLAVSCVVREGEARFRLKFETIDVPSSQDRGADIAAATALVQAAIERFVRAHPGQWMWAHRRWG